MLTANLLARGFSRPVYATSPPGDPSRLFVIEQHTGRIRILDPVTGEINQTPFLQVPGLSNRNEQGLLGLAFHPDYENNGQFFVNFTASNGTTVVRRYEVSADNPNVANPDSALNLLTISQPFSNHNGGWMGFGPNDGYLYIASGDGGDRFDPGNRAQDTTRQLLGKMLRIDVNGDDFPDDRRNYAVPADNPFVGTDGDDEIWAYGLRNPWRSSFDRDTGDLYIGDVGQDEIEEINFQPAESPGGENYGWRLREGTRNTGLGSTSGLELVDPIHEYDHSFGVSVTGGYVYRGNNIGGDLAGTYFFADFATSRIWSLRYEDGEVEEFVDRTAELRQGARISQVASFAEDANGDLYAVSLGGSIYQILAVPAEGDADLDGDVDLEDFAVLRNGFGVGSTVREGDVTDDGQVDLRDFSLLKSRFGSDSRSQQMGLVPEPATFGTLLTGLLVASLLAVRKRSVRV